MKTLVTIPDDAIKRLQALEHLVRSRGYARNYDHGIFLLPRRPTF